MDTQIIDNILPRFTETTGIRTKWMPDRVDNEIDGFVTLTADGNKQVMLFEAKNSVTQGNLPRLVRLLKAYKKFVVLANNIAPDIKKQLKDNGINYIDGAGNANIKVGNIYVYIEGIRLTPVKDHKTKPFSKAGLKVIFHLLQYPEQVNDTIRELAQKADVSLDTLHKTIQGLKQGGYLIPADKKNLQWHNRTELLQKWTEEYETRLKPSLHTGNFRFLNDTAFYEWKDLTFKDPEITWSGEPGGELYTGFLKPEILTIYTNELKSKLLKTNRMIPDTNGYIKVFQKFWKEDHGKKNVAPPVLVYSDLINTGNKRNIETAQKIYDKFLQSKF